MVGKGGSKVQQRIAIIGLRCYLQSLVHLSRSLKEQGIAIAQETLMSMAILLLYEIIEFVTVTAGWLAGEHWQNKGVLRSGFTTIVRGSGELLDVPVQWGFHCK